MEFTECIADGEKVLADLSLIIGFVYSKGSFCDFEDTFCDSNLDDDFFIIKTEFLKISVHLEKYEGYFFLTITGEGKSFSLAKEYLVNHGKGI